MPEEFKLLYFWGDADTKYCIVMEFRKYCTKKPGTIFRLSICRKRNASHSINPSFKILEKTACYQRFYVSFRIATKNVKKLLVLHHHKIYFHEFFRMAKSIKELWRRKLLIIDFFPCYLNGNLRALSRGISNHKIWMNE